MDNGQKNTDLPQFSLPAPSEKTVIEPSKPMLLWAWWLALFGAWTIIKTMSGLMVTGQDLLPWPVYLMAGAVISLLFFIWADMVGARYTVSLSCIKRRGLFRIQNRMDWESVTVLRLERGLLGLRMLSIQAGRRCFSTSLGIWPVERHHFFKAARHLVAIARSRNIPINNEKLLLSKNMGPGDIKRWFYE